MMKSFMMGAAGALSLLVLIVGVAYAADIFTVGKDGTVRMVITDTGMVGIGTASPNTNLHVENVAADATFRVRRTGGSDYYVTSLGNVSVLGTAGATDLDIRTNNVGGRIYIQSGGNVGVGTTDPKTKMHVTGLPEYADNAAALAAGLTAGAFYRTGDLLKVVH